jgi:hypothetical protein
VKTFPCAICGDSYEADVPESPGDWTGDDLAAAMEAQSDHLVGHRSPGTDVHIKKQIARTSGYSPVNPLHDSAAFRLSAAHNGSQTLCGDPATDRDVSWSDARSAKCRQHVTCARCLQLRPVP